MRSQPKLRLVLFCILLCTLAFAMVALSAYTALPEEQAAAELVQDETNVPTVSLVHSDEVLRGKSFTVDIVLSGNVNGLTSLKLILEYDPSVMYLTTYPESGMMVVQGEALSGLSFYYSHVEPILGGDPTINPIEFVWNGQDAVFSEGVLCSLSFRTISTDDDSVLTKWPLTLTYDPINTFYTTPHEDIYDAHGDPIPNGGVIRYQKVEPVSSEIEIVRGAYKCTWKDWDDTILKDVEEGEGDFMEFSASVSSDPKHPDRAADNCYIYTYEEDQWSARCTITEEDLYKPFVITAGYTRTPQPYTVYYYFGEKDPETGEIDIAETAGYYYRYNRYYIDDNFIDSNLVENAGFVTQEPIEGKYGGEIVIPARLHHDYVEEYYSISEWYTDIECTKPLTVDRIPEDTTGNFSLKLYAYKQRNEENVPQNLEELYLSKVESTVTVDGDEVTVKVSLLRNFGLRTMAFTLGFDTDVLTFTGFEACAEAMKTIDFRETPSVGISPYVIYMIRENENFDYTGELFTLTFTLDTANASVGTYPILLCYREKVDITRFFTEGDVYGTSSRLWYTDLLIDQGAVVVQNVDAPTASEETYYFNAADQRYTFATNGDMAHYDIVTQDTYRDPGEYVVTVRLKSGDHVYRFWTAEEGRPVADLDFDFVILKRSVTPPTDPGAYVYNTHEQTYVFTASTDSDYYTTTGTFKRTNVGTETITVTLKYPEETYWGADESDADPKLYTFEIVKYSVTRPTATTATYIFDNTEKTYDFASLGESTLYTVKEGTDKRTASGEQDVVCELTDKANYRWAEGDSEDLTFLFVVQQRAIDVPSTQQTNYVYDGTEKTFYMTDATYYTVSDNKRTDAGDYKAKVTLRFESDTYWKESEPISSSPLYFDFVIAKALVTPPTAMETSYTFDREEHEYVFKTTGDTDLYHLSNGTVLKKTASGTTDVVAQLNDPLNYRWKEGDSEDLVFPFTIAKRAVIAPVANAFYQYSFNGEDQTFWMTDTNYYTVSNNVRKYAGVYEGEEEGVKVALIYPDDTYWKNSEPISSAPLYFTFEIKKMRVDRPTIGTKKYYFTGEAQTYAFLSAEGLGTLYTATNATQTNAGYYEIVVSLIDTENSAWKPENPGDPISIRDIVVPFTILPKPVAKPGLKQLSGGSLKKYYFVDDETPIHAEYDRVLETDYYAVSGDVQTHAGSYTIVFSLRNTEEATNYCWNGDSSTADHTLTFKIEKRVVTAPIGDGGTTKVVGYNGAVQTYPFLNPDAIATNKDVYFTVAYSPAEQFKNAGDYTITFSLLYPEDTYWDTGAEDVADKVFTLTIKKTPVLPPSLTNKKYQEGLIQTSGLEATDEYAILSDEGGEHAGTYEVVLELKDANYEWSDNSALPLNRTFTYVIEQNPNAWVVSPYTISWTYGSEPELRGGFATPKFGADDLEITYAPLGSTVYTSDLPVNAGTYIVRFFVPHTDDYLADLSASASLVVEQAEIDLADVDWQEDRTFTFNGEEQGVLLVDLPSGVTAIYSGEKAIHSGNYTATVNLAPTDATNYKLVNLPAATCAYVIDPLEVTVVWSDTTYVYKKTAYDYPTASYTDVNEEIVTGLTVVPEEAEFRASGTYHFSTHIDDEDYVAKAGTTEHVYTIAKRVITPPTDPGVYTYNTQAQTYAYTDSADKDYYYVAGNLTRTYVGTETITFALTDPDDTYWAGEGESTDPILFTFEIVKCPVTRPTASEEVYTFTGATLSYTFADAGESTLYSVEEGTDRRIASGAQDVVCVLNDKDNYRWADGDSEDITFSFSVGKRAVDRPATQTTNYVYDGTKKTFYMTDSTYYVVSQNEETNAGEYLAEVALRYPADTYWKESDPLSSDPLFFDFVIAKASVAKPQPKTTAFTFNMTTQQYLFEDPDFTLYEVADESDLRYDAGEQKVRLSLKYPDNYHWQGEGSADIYYTFLIEKKAVTQPTPVTKTYVYDGSAHAFALENTDDESYYRIDGLYRTDAGSYVGVDAVRITLRDAANTFWKDSDGSVEALAYPFIVEKRIVAAPVASTEIYVYNRHEQTYSFTEIEADKAYYGITGSFTRTNAGTHRITAKLNEPLNCEWDVGGSADLGYDFTILPASVAKPAPDERHFVCNGETQTYTVALSELYTLSGTSKSTGGTTYVRIALLDKENYVWESGEEQATSDDLLYPFTIEHVFENKAVEEAYFAAPADCTHGAKYYFVCRCGEHGTETYEVGDPLGHDYRADFKWEKREDAEGDFYVVRYVAVTCARCDYSEEMSATVECVVTKTPGLNPGEKRYDASLRIGEQLFTDSRTVVVPPIGYEFSDPTWTKWVFTSATTATVEAVFIRTDSDGTESEIRIPAEGVFTDNGDDTYRITAEVLFNGVEYRKVEDLNKPTVTFRVSEDEAEDIVRIVMPGDVILLPERPEREDAIFLKWQNEEGVSLFYGETGNTPFTMSVENIVFDAIWKEIQSGKLIVYITNWEDEEIEIADCVLSPEDAERAPATYQDGRFVFEEVSYGNYSIIVTYATDGATLTYTTGTILGEREKTVSVTLSKMKFNTKVEDDANTNASVENLENSVSKEEDPGALVDVTVTLSIKDTDEDVKEAIKEIVEEQEKDLVGVSYITLEKTVVVLDEYGNPDSDPDTSDLDYSEDLVDITFPITEELYNALAQVRGSVENILVVKGDGTAVSFLTKLSKSAATASDNEEECFYIAEEDDVPYIVVRTKSFSMTYGLCVGGAPLDPTLKENLITIILPDEWNYGEEVTPALTSTYGDLVVYYRDNKNDGTQRIYNQLPGAPGEYIIFAHVDGTDVYQSADAQKIFRINTIASPFVQEIVFNDTTVFYDGRLHSILVEGLPEGATVVYSNNNSQAEIGEYVITATINFGEGYEPVEKTAVLRIIMENEEECERSMWFPWILIVIAVVLTVLLILLFLRGKKYKREIEEEQGLSAVLLLCALSNSAWWALVIALIVLDVVLLGLVIWKFLANRKAKKRLEEIRSASEEEKEDDEEASEKEPTEEQSAQDENASAEK